MKQTKTEFKIEIAGEQVDILDIVGYGWNEDEVVDPLEYLISTLANTVAYKYKKEVEA